MKPLPWGTSISSAKALKELIGQKGKEDMSINDYTALKIYKIAQGKANRELLVEIRGWWHC